MSEKRAMIVLPSDRLGGAESRLKLVATELIRRGFFVDVVFFSKSLAQGWADLNPNSITLHFAPFARVRLGAMPAIFKVVSLSRKNRYEFAFSSNTSINGILGIFKRFSLVRMGKLVVRESTLVMDRFSGVRLQCYKFLYSHGYKYCDLVICQTDQMRRSLLEKISRASNWNMHVIPNPIDREDLKDKAGAQFTWPEEHNDKYLVGVGRLVPLKGFDLLIEAIALIARDDLHLVLIGDGPEADRLRDHAVAHGISDRIHLVGFKSNPYPYMAAASVCVVSSRIEGFPNVLLEMMALNDTVVSTHCAGGIDEIEGLFSCSANDNKMLADSIAMALKSTDQESKRRRELLDSELAPRSPEEFLDKILDLVA